MNQAYPLAWPDGWKRTEDFRRQDSKFKVTLAAACSDLVSTLRKLGAVGTIVVSTNIPAGRLNSDAALYPKASAEKKVEDPGVAVYWTVREGTHRTLTAKVMACDSWRTVRENIRALWLALEALLTIRRIKASAVFERAYSAFNVLPPTEEEQAPPPVKRSWREVLGFTLKVATLHDVKLAYRKLCFMHHPDLEGGNNAKQVELNEAWEEAKKELEDQ